MKIDPENPWTPKSQNFNLVFNTTLLLEKAHYCLRCTDSNKFPQGVYFSPQFTSAIVEDKELIAFSELNESISEAMFVLSFLVIAFLGYKVAKTKSKFYSAILSFLTVGNGLTSLRIALISLRTYADVSTDSDQILIGLMLPWQLYVLFKMCCWQSRKNDILRPLKLT